eukprot:scaffold922_cov327-Pinguiococcus_pyrenoidosus.AAC.9
MADGLSSPSATAQGASNSWACPLFPSRSAPRRFQEAPPGGGLRRTAHDAARSARTSIGRESHSHQASSSPPCAPCARASVAGDSSVARPSLRARAVSPTGSESSSCQKIPSPVIPSN